MIKRGHELRKGLYSMLNSLTDMLIVNWPWLSLYSILKIDAALSCEGSVAIATGYMLDNRSSIPERGIFLLTSSTRALRPIQSPIQWVKRVRVKRSRCEIHYSPPSRDEVMNGETISQIPHTASRCGAWLIKHGENFTFTLRSSEQATRRHIPDTSIFIATAMRTLHLTCASWQWLYQTERPMPVKRTPSPVHELQECPMI
jgi:hypothetical protein